MTQYSPDVAPDLEPDVVHWQPTHRSAGSPSTTQDRYALGALALGATAVGALAVGAAAIGVLAIGRLFVRRGRFHTLEIDHLIVHHLDLPRR
jgi:hypothetical protein